MRRSGFALAVVLFAWTWTPGIAQRADEGEPAKVPPPPGDEQPGRGRFVERLPPEMRERFQAAREKALQDPKLQELWKTARRANREFFKAMRDKMMEIDPALAEMVRKTMMERKARRAWRDEDGTPRFDSLSPDEREKFVAALGKARDDPAVQAAREKKWDAITADERSLASSEYRKVLEQAVIKIDPSLAPVVEKLRRPANPKEGLTPTTGPQSQ